MAASGALKPRSHHLAASAPALTASGTKSWAEAGTSSLSLTVEAPCGMPDICSISDTELAARLKFVKEIGTGCWGHCWLVQPKRSDSLSYWSHGGPTPTMTRACVKLVHRTTSSTTAARIRALWSEYKVIRSLRCHQHPNLITFSDFIVTPSYALITMEYHEKQMPVGMNEAEAKPFCAQILDAVGFMHKQGFTHNDIKIANILISYDNKPVLIDFGFAKNYRRLMSNQDHDTSIMLPAEVDPNILGASTMSTAPQQAFYSSMSWGTPEYLSPERAKGCYHDERLADVWSTGVTMYELVVGRTPFERDETEEFLTKEALEVYYERTISGNFYGHYNITTAFEQVIRAMIKADLNQRISNCFDVLQMPFFELVATKAPASTLKDGQKPVMSTPSRNTKTFKVFVDPEGLAPGDQTSPQKTSTGKENISPACASSPKNDVGKRVSRPTVGKMPLRSPTRLAKGGVDSVEASKKCEAKSLTDQCRQMSGVLTSIPQWSGRQLSARPATVFSSLKSDNENMSEQADPSHASSKIAPSTPHGRPSLSHRLASTVTAALIGSSDTPIKRSPTAHAEQKSRSSGFLLIDTPNKSCENGRRAKASLPESSVFDQSGNSSFTDRLDRIQGFARQIDQIVEIARSRKGDRLILPSPPPLARPETSNPGVLDRSIDVNELRKYAERMQAAVCPQTASESGAGLLATERASSGPDRSQEPEQSDMCLQLKNPQPNADALASDEEQDVGIAERHIFTAVDNGADPDASVLPIVPKNEPASTVEVESFHHDHDDDNLDDTTASQFAVGSVSEGDETLVISSIGITQRLEGPGCSHFSTPTPTKEEMKQRVSFDLLNWRSLGQHRWAFARPSMDEISDRSNLPERVQSPTPSLRDAAHRVFRRFSRRERTKSTNTSGHGLSRFKSMLCRKR